MTGRDAFIMALTELGKSSSEIKDYVDIDDRLGLHPRLGRLIIEGNKREIPVEEERIVIDALKQGFCAKFK